MNLRQLIHNLSVMPQLGDHGFPITTIAEDSRLATPGCLFIARPGTKQDGRKYIHDAIAHGAIAILTNEPSEIPPGVPTLITEDVPAIAAILAERFYGNPTNTLQLIGITGTNGKTTTAYLVRHLLNSARKRCGLIGTVQIDDGLNVVSADLTTPPAIELSRLLRAMVDHGCEACAMEASSHALHQKRTAGLNFHIGVFTNITGDHLDYHNSMDGYLDAKCMLFEQLKPDGWAVINTDDPASQAIIKRTQAGIATCSLLDSSASYFARLGRQTLSHIETTFHGPCGSLDIGLPLIGRHNVMNALQAFAVGHLIGLSRSQLEHGLSTCTAPPGRLEPVTTPEDDFAILVDYAHTDDALENVLRCLREVINIDRRKGTLRVVFGCGGDRDRSKRPRMARVACRWADDVIITSDNPRTEDPQAIIDEIRTGIAHDKFSATSCIVDRAAAIREAVERTQEGDILLIAGKGHEDYQIIGTAKRPFDDRKIAAEALRQRGAKVVAA